MDKFKIMNTMGDAADKKAKKAPKIPAKGPQKAEIPVDDGDMDVIPPKKTAKKVK